MITRQNKQPDGIKITPENVHKIGHAFGSGYTELARILGHETALSLVYDAYEQDRYQIPVPKSFSLSNPEAVKTYERITELEGQEAAENLAKHAKNIGLTEFSFPPLDKLERELTEIQILDDFKAVLSLPPNDQYKKFSIIGSLNDKDVVIFFEFARDAIFNSRYGRRYCGIKDILDLIRITAARYALARYHAGGYENELVSFEPGNLNSFAQFLFDSYQFRTPYQVEALIEEYLDQAEDNQAENHKAKERKAGK